MNTKAIVFDAYGTLFDVNSAAEKCKDKIGDQWEGFANFWRTTQLEYTWLRSLMKRHKNFWKVTEDSLDNHIIGVLAEKVLNNHFAMVLTKDQTSLHYNTKQINPKKFFSVLVNLLKISLYVMDHIMQNKS